MRSIWVKKILVLGLSKSGIAAAKFLNKQGADVFLSEFRAQKPEDTAIIEELESAGIHVETGAHSDEFIEGAAFAVASPGIPPHSGIFRRLEQAGIRIISEIELAYTNTKIPFIAITGTNGKTTVTALVSHILSAKYNAPACGNYGLPPTDLLDSGADYFVCECSSYQLETSPSFAPKTAVWTNFTPDHIEWHEGLENYFNAKAKMFRPGTIAVLNAADERLLEFSREYTGKVFFFGAEKGENCCYNKDGAIVFKQDGREEKIIALDECPLIGEHNYQNIQAAVICAKLEGLDNETIAERLKSFKVPEHRMEKFASRNGIDFYNDSKATNPEAAMVAIKSFSAPACLPVQVKTDIVPEFRKTKDLKKWILENLSLIGDITIKSNNRNVSVSKSSIARSLKRDKKEASKRNSYSRLKELAENVYFSHKRSDDKHSHRQEVYYMALEYGCKIYGVEFAVDIPNKANEPYVYAGHKLKEIPSAATGVRSNEVLTHRPDGISLLPPATVTGFASNEVENPSRDDTISITDIQKFFNPGKNFCYKNVVLIAGGRDKNTDLGEFCESVKKHITTVVLIGEAADRFEQNLRESGFCSIKRAGTLQEAVDVSIALKPDVVLLSPACASFDMFSGYEERGRVFKDYVKSK
jgi:UDP-N-acetylmuramoylalanine--D-glutamate ligase